MKRAGYDLKRALLRRVTLFALLICALASAVVLHQASTRIRADIERTGGTIERLIGSEATQPRDVFRRSIEGMQLSMLEQLGGLLNICVEVDDIYGERIAQRCFAEGGAPPRALRWIMARLVGPEVAYHGVIGQYPGIKVGEFRVTPDLDREALEVWRQIRTVLAMTAGVLLLNLLVYLPVRRALQPTDEILSALARMEQGDLSVRMPRPALDELARIAAGFDHLAARLQETSQAQRLLAQRLLSVREEERRHLARELHDEFGQCLTSIRAEAAYATELAHERLPELLPSAEAIARVTAHLMESLQGILHQLRPIGLEEFGLHAGLAQLARAWRQGSRADCRCVLEVDGEIDDLSDELAVSLYRIVQESLTNAARHGDAREVRVTLRRARDHIRLAVRDDGQGFERRSAGTGLGVLGMHERVQALGGRFALNACVPRGMQVEALIPLAAAAR